MEIYHEFLENGPLRGCSLALGNFDGVHLGHRALFDEAKRHGQAVALTFHPHPGKVLQPELAPKLITPLPRKLELFEELGLRAAVVLPFSREYAHTSPANFESMLLRQAEAKHIVVGRDFTYGAVRAGNVNTLRSAAESSGAEVHEIPPVTVDGVVASSSRIREYLLEGRMEAAQRLLGRYFDLEGVVVKGQGRGRGIGFPTANVETHNELRPAPGVYAVKLALIPEIGTNEPWAWRLGAANIGVRPTFGGSELSIEVHVLDFSGDFYNRKVRIQFLHRVRPEHRFGSSAELSSQIHLDVKKIRALFG